ncbi:NlpC/P60 family putative phage cell wall peptidase [Peteryoungia aggregata LMG 23059]|uniref:NlpC/P60 family putative phage cell wall peptidase n=1 Tax=Peteryoungia aggregata LMG 23059 TaxID=1368425 RepID=A0ABU0GCS6_9HYPH|nr:NlpC/P60 family protein [Peteryoungia aggregata]MDQ0423150.1 NlpC/P60 family putative phage cell wall peptidase [Peteryoungia aggregata LMG 23059]
MSVNAQVLAIAGCWIGTPYRHQGAVKGVGCDCLGLVRGIWRELYGREPEAVPAYASDWAERAGEERLLAAADRHFRIVPSREESLPGDLVLFRFRPHLAAKHAGILSLLPGEDVAHGQAEDPAPGDAQARSRPGFDRPTPDAFIHAPNAFIHAYEQSAVTLSALVPGWRRKIAGIYRFPERI